MKKVFTLMFAFIVSSFLYSQTSEYSWRYYRPGNTGIQGDNATALWVNANGDPYIAANTGNWGEGGFALFNQSGNQWINYSNVDYPVLGSFENAEVQILDIVEDKEHLPGQRYSCASCADQSCWSYINVRHKAFSNHSGLAKPCPR
ncbi:MAG: hypothetical protein M9948_06395 [Lentimicrobium sp.]|nr:hypothetical protein [Lentimicrobium sp.]HPG34603.1 hypothetical protein [Lentimicrobium sp.]